MADIDARLDRLTERHEALAQSLEIIAGMQRENEKKISALADTVDRLIGSLTTLVDIVRSHENRLNNLES